MPARKPKDLIVRHNTKAEDAARELEEESLRSEKPVPVEPPARLGTNEIAVATWRRLMREYGRLEARIVSRLDMDLLVDYCQVMAQLDEMDKLRDAARETWKFYNQQRIEFIKNGDPGSALTLAEKINDAFELIVKLDARIDQKRKMLLTMRQSLYLTPRARAGVAPKGKEEKPPEDEMTSLLSGGFEDDFSEQDGEAGGTE